MIHDTFSVVIKAKYVFDSIFEHISAVFVLITDNKLQTITKKWIVCKFQWALLRSEHHWMSMCKYQLVKGAYTIPNDLPTPLHKNAKKFH